MSKRKKFTDIISSTISLPSSEPYDVNAMGKSQNHEFTGFYKVGHMHTYTEHYTNKSGFAPKEPPTFSGTGTGMLNVADASLAFE